MNNRMERHESQEDYLEAILQINQEQGACRAIQIAEKLSVSKPSVSVALGKLAAMGLIQLTQDKWITLTEEGRRIAQATYTKHQYFKAFFLSLDVDENTAEKEACGLEHIVSEDTFQKIQAKYPLNVFQK